jgi:sugar/nucleoside kinase (ribokinase family)
VSIVAVGSIAFDTIKTPFGEATDIVGGALTYFALSASFFAEVKPVAVVGEDFGEDAMSVFAGRRIDLSGIERAPGKTFRWGAEYSYNLNSRETLFTELNVFEHFEPRLPESHCEADIVFLGNIHPSLQLRVVRQVRSKRLVGLDSMNLWIQTTPKDLNDALKEVDILKIDDSEVRQLSGEYNLRKAATAIQQMGPRMLVATRGSHGSMLFNGSDIFAVTAYPLEDEVDPTGAGDSFAGGFFGYLAQNRSLDQETLRRAVIFGSVMGSFCVEDFGTRRLERLSLDEINSRYREIKQLTHFEDVEIA